MSKQSPGIAFFITPHGFGHAARASAVMEALASRCPGIRFELFTTIPSWFFSSSISAPCTIHPVDCDVGLVQKDALIEDVPVTLERLKRLYPFDPGLVNHLARQVRDTGCDLVVSDIAPLGIAVAEVAGLPSVLIENFTWDWIYAAYIDEGGPELQAMIDHLAMWFGKATYHIQTEPVCRPVARASLMTSLVARSPRTGRVEIRKQLGVSLQRPLVLLTMGGSVHRYTFFDKLAARGDVSFVLPGIVAPVNAPKNLLCLPPDSPLYHPDLVMAVDAVVGKVGYSTLAEVWQAGVPFGYVIRERFPESQPLERFIIANLSGCPVSAVDFNSGRWLDQLDALLALPRKAFPKTQGALQIASFLLKLLPE